MEVVTDAPKQQEYKETTIEGAEVTTEHTSIKPLTLEESFTTEEQRNNREITTNGYLTTTVAPVQEGAKESSTEQVEEEVESTLTPQVESEELTTVQVHSGAEKPEEVTVNPVPQVTERIAEPNGEEEEGLVVVVPSEVIPMTTQEEIETTTIADVQQDTTAAAAAEAVGPAEAEQVPEVVEVKEEEATTEAAGAVVEKEAESVSAVDESAPELELSPPVTEINEGASVEAAEVVTAALPEVTTPEVVNQDPETEAVAVQEAEDLTTVAKVEDVPEPTTTAQPLVESTQSSLEALFAAQSSGD